MTVAATASAASSEIRRCNWSALPPQRIEIIAAILDRLLHDPEILTINGPSWRLRDRSDLLANDTKTAKTMKTARPIPLGDPAEALRKPHKTLINRSEPLRDAQSGRDARSAVRTRPSVVKRPPVVAPGDDVEEAHEPRIGPFPGISCEPDEDVLPEPRSRLGFEHDLDDAVLAIDYARLRSQFAYDIKLQPLIRRRQPLKDISLYLCALVRAWRLEARRDR